MSNDTASPASPAGEKPDALAFLSSHFDLLKPQRVEVEGVPCPLFYRPLTTAEAFKLANARSEANPARKAAMFAELLVASVNHEDGTPVFPLVKGGPNPVQVLTTRTLPKVFSEMVSKLLQIFNGADVAEDLEKKSPEEASA